MRLLIAAVALALASLSGASFPVRAATCTYDYDQLGRLISMICKNGGTTILTVTYSYDDAGNRTAQSKTP